VGGKEKHEFQKRQKVGKNQGANTRTMCEYHGGGNPKGDGSPGFCAEGKKTKGGEKEKSEKRGDWDGKEGCLH